METARNVRVRVIASAGDRERAYAIRRRVFQHEQGVPAEEEFDGDDDLALHLIAEAAGTAVGTGRIVFHTDHAKVGRMAVLEEWRRQGVGRALLEEFIRIAAARGLMRILLHAQVQAIPFYQALQFVVISEQFEEAGIPHQKMERRLRSQEE
jgi:putative N-acetyltransferase (TIGR04045 family)